MNGWNTEKSEPEVYKLLCHRDALLDAEIFPRLIIKVKQKFLAF